MTYIDSAEFPDSSFKAIAKKGLALKWEDRNDAQVMVNAIQAAITKEETRIAGGEVDTTGKEADITQEKIEITKEEPTTPKEIKNPQLDLLKKKLADEVKKHHRPLAIPIGKHHYHKALGGKEDNKYHILV